MNTDSFLKAELYPDSDADTFCYYDGPLIFAFKHDGAYHFAYWCDQEDKVSLTYLVRPLSDEELSALRAWRNIADLRSIILGGSSLFEVTTDWSKGHVTGVKVVTPQQASSERKLPDEGVLLFHNSPPPEGATS